MQNKTELRIIAKRIRKGLDIASVSSAIVANIRKSDEYTRAKHVMIYYPLKYEINLLSLLEDKDKLFYLPRVNGSGLDCCPYKKGDDLILSSLNILEPCAAACDKSKIDVVFVPALMADLSFNRLGYGAGFYDRFLSDLNSLKVIPIAEELLIEVLPSEPSDIKCDALITQKKASFERG